MVIPPAKPCASRRWRMTTAEALGSISTRRAISSLKGSSLLKRVKLARVRLGSSRYLCTVCRAIPRVPAILRTERPSWAKRWMSKMVRLLIIVSSQRIADQPPDRRRVGLFHLRWTLQRSWPLAHRCGWQREDLKEVSIKGDEVLVEEGIAGHDVVIQRKLQKRTDLIVAIVRQAVSVRDQDEKHIQQELML